MTARRRFLFAVSGGRAPCLMLRALAGEDIPWGAVHLFQVDERVALAGDPDRNLTCARAFSVTYRYRQRICTPCRWSRRTLAPLDCARGRAGFRLPARS